MSGIFGSIKRTARTGRLKTELYMLDREIRQRQDAFGVQLYDYLEPLAKNPTFFSAGDRLTEVLRPPLLEAQRETAVIYTKQSDLKERTKQAEVTRAAAFPKKAENWKERLSNAATSASLAAGEAKLSHEMSVLERQLKSQKQRFGRSLYGKLEEMEDKEGWLPTDREVRSIYDACRKDIEVIRKKAKVKIDELETLGVSQSEIQDERDSENAKDNEDMYNAPMAPVHDLKPVVSPPASAPPVATPVNDYSFPTSDTPVLAYVSPTPPTPPLEPPPPLPSYDHQSHGTGGGEAVPGMPGTMGGSMGGSYMGNSFAGGAGGMGGSTGESTFQIDDDEGDFVMGGGAGSGTRGASESHQQPINVDPWAAVAPPPSSAPPPPSYQQQPGQEQPGKHKDSNLFLY